VPLATNTGQGDRPEVLGEIAGQRYLKAMVPSMRKAVRKNGDISLGIAKK
jgi:hypothetical protein